VRKPPPDDLAAGRLLNHQDRAAVAWAIGEQVATDIGLTMHPAAGAFPVEPGRRPRRTATADPPGE
jgi:hypothetical protein